MGRGGGVDWVMVSVCVGGGGGGVDWGMGEDCKPYSSPILVFVNIIKY